LAFRFFRGITILAPKAPPNVVYKASIGFPVLLNNFGSIASLIRPRAEAVAVPIIHDLNLLSVFLNTKYEVTPPTNVPTIKCSGYPFSENIGCASN